jgi:large conductance mechanosensitive channel
MRNFGILAEADWGTGKSARPPPDSPNSMGVTHVKGFRQFITRGNLIDLAVAVVIGTAFTALVTALVADLITPLIAAIGGKRDFSAFTFTVNHSTFRYGSFVNAVLSFLIIAAVVYFLIVSPTARVTSRLTRHKEATERECPECLSTIPIAASRCKFCTAQVTPAVH